MRPKARQPGQPRLARAATAIAARAKGNAKAVWENRTNEAHLLRVDNIEHPTSNIQHPIADSDQTAEDDRQRTSNIHHRINHIQALAGFGGRMTGRL
jgi:hypothetical protein